MNPRRTSLATVDESVRCAIYTRKSTTEGLDSAFTTLDNQRERAEAYIASQADQGWTPLPDRYDDGGYSGGTVERPALKRLLADVERGLVDTIVVYRLDRLSRSLVDFGRVHEFLEKHDVGLVSVTESINTSSPHGRMMVNVLLSFAQYERELIGERTKDKIRAARRRGKWTGGMPPLGYDVAPEGGRLVVNKSEAAQVVPTFELYLERGSLVATVEELNRRGWRRKSWTTKSGRVREGREWDRTTLRKLLTDPTYRGMQRLGDETFQGEHDAIVGKRLFDDVQRQLAANAGDGGSGRRNRHGALLRGLIRCSACDRAMSYTWSKGRGGKRLYRYYSCNRRMKQGASACPTKSIPADKVEGFVVEQIQRIGADPDLQNEVFRQAVEQVRAERRGLKAEATRLRRDLKRTRATVARLVTTLAEASGQARTAVAAELEQAQAHVETLTRRINEIGEREAVLASQTVDKADLARALEAFAPVWDVLLQPERERVLQLLISQVRYDGSTQQLEIDFALAGVAELAEEVGGGS